MRLWGASVAGQGPGTRPRGRPAAARFDLQSSAHNG